MPDACLSFPPFRLDRANAQLWRDEELVALRPKTFAILRYLVEHPNRLVTKEEMLRAVWGDTLVSEDGLRDYLREIRQALCDDANAPRFVETVRGRGYRFLPATTTQPVSSSRFKVQSYRSPIPDARCPRRSRSLLPQSHRHRSQAAGQDVGTARHSEPSAALAAGGQAH